MYQLHFSKKAYDELQELNKVQARLITLWVKRNFEQFPSNRTLGKKLKSDSRDFWRYRVGDYRVFIHVEKQELIILTIPVGHRNNSYVYLD